MSSTRPPGNVLDRPLISEQNFRDWCEKNREIVGLATAVLATGIFATCYGLTCRGLLHAFQTNDPYTFSAFVCTVTSIAHDQTMRVSLVAGLVCGVGGALLAADRNSDWSIESRVSHYTDHHPKATAVAVGVLTALMTAGSYYAGRFLIPLAAERLADLPRVNLSFLYKGMTPVFILMGCAAAYYSWSRTQSQDPNCYPSPL